MATIRNLGAFVYSSSCFVFEHKTNKQINNTRKEY